jgi:Flp pilus assembly protein TadG
MAETGRRRSPGGERGADVFEAALVLPILLTLFLAFWSFGRGWDTYQTMTRAAREGARQAVTTNCATCGNVAYTDTQIRDQFVFPALQAAGLDTSNTLLQSSYTQGYTWMDSAHLVCGIYIKFSYPYTIHIPFTPVPMTTITLTTNVQMRMENQPLGSTCP